MKTVIAIDGPAASGKSSVARRIATQLGFAYVNSGTFYRVMTWWVLQAKTALTTVEAIDGAIAKADFDSGFDGDEAFFRIDGASGGDYELRGESVNKSVSLVSSAPGVRRVVTERLRLLAEARDLVMEGRDIGSVVFPETAYKFYIDASPEVRRQRRAAQGQLDEIAQRDKLDSSRANAPLTIATDATVVDSSHLGVDEVKEAVLRGLQEKGLTALVR